MVHGLLNRLGASVIKAVLRCLSRDARPLNGLEGLRLLVQGGRAPLREFVSPIFLNVRGVRSGQLVARTASEMKACAVGSPTMRS